MKNFHEKLDNIYFKSQGLSNQLEVSLTGNINS